MCVWRTRLYPALAEAGRYGDGAHPAYFEYGLDEPEEVRTYLRT